MNTRYSFYIGNKNKDGELEILGPVCGHTVLPFYSRLDTDIDTSSVTASMNVVPSDKLSQDKYSISVFGYIDKELGPSVKKTVLAMPLKRALALGNNGYIEGFTTLDEANYLASHDYSAKALRKVHLYSANVIANMVPSQRDKYVKVSTVTTDSIGYIASLGVNYAELMSRLLTAKNIHIVCVIRAA